MNNKNNHNVNNMCDYTTSGVANSNSNGINQNRKRITNNINPSISLVEKIIDNIKNNKKDWLEIEDEVRKDIKNKITEIKDQIINDFYDSSIETKIEINVILDCILNDDYKNIFKINSAFNRSLSIEFNELIQKIKPNFDWPKYDELKIIICNAKKNIDKIEQFEQSFQELKISLNQNIVSKVKMFIKQYIGKLYSKYSETSTISYVMDYSLILKDLMNQFKSMQFSDFYDLEKNALITSLFLSEIKCAELNNFNILINESRKYIKENFLNENVQKILEDIHSFIENHLNKKLEKKKNLVVDIKSFSKKYCLDQSSNINNVDIDEDRIRYIIKKLIGNKALDWTKPPNSDISLDSLIYHYQNNSES